MERERAAIDAESSYKPGFFDRTLNRAGEKRAKLAEAVLAERAADEETYQRLLQEWRKKHEDWKDSRDFAERVLAGDIKALGEAIETLNPFSDIAALGSSLNFSIHDTGIVDAALQVHSEDVVPKEALSLLKSGRLATRQMPKSRFNELYQDHVCSCVLRVANELFAILPVDMVFVTAEDKLLNTQTGHLEETSIVSAAIPRETIRSLNLDLIDPSDSMSSFAHRMHFNKTSGFSGVERLGPEELEADQPRDRS